MSRSLVVSARASAQLDALFDYLEVNASPEIARRFVGDIVDRLDRLVDPPFQGTKRDDILPGLRTVGFRRRVTIAFHADDEGVVILGVFYGGQNFEAVLR